MIKIKSCFLTLTLLAATAVAAIIEACRRGPRGARVDLLDERDGNADDLALRGAGKLFSVLPTV